MHLFWIIIFFFTSLQAFGQDVLYSDLVKENYTLGQTALKFGKLDKANGHFKKCIENNMDCYEAHLNIAHILFLQNKYKASLELCNEINKEAPFLTGLNEQYSRTYYTLGNYELAERHLKKEISIGTKNAKYYAYLGEILHKRKKYDESLFYFEEALSFDSLDYNTWVRQGEVLMDLSQYPSAIEKFESAHKINPKNSTILLQLANAYFSSSEDNKALNSIEKGIQLGEDESIVKFYLLKGNHFQEEELIEEAIIAYDKAHNLDQNNPIVLTCQASTLIKLGEYEKAIAKCNLALELNPKLMEAFFNRGIANEMVRDLEGACNDWQKAFILGSARAEDYLNGPICNE